MEVLASGLAFPEGPVVLDDGSVLVGEQGRARITRVSTEGALSVLAETGGAPNGLALGPDGSVYVANNGGLEFATDDGRWTPTGLASDHRGGSVQRVDPTSGAVEAIITSVEGSPLGAPNDLVFDDDGMCWFTDTLRGCVFVADVTTGTARTAVSGLNLPNGIGFSSDRTMYVSETWTGNLVTVAPGAGTAELLWSSRGAHGLDSLAVHPNGDICVASLGAPSGITVIAPTGDVRAVVPVPDPDEYVTNICFGGDDAGVAYITSGQLGRLYVTPWRC